jgi:RNA polymerase sporulation-specific sigma factor
MTIRKYNDELANLILENDKLIHSLTNQFGGYSSKEDLYQVGVIGLISAYRNYDESRGSKFSTYAYPYILGEMKKYLREDRGLKISRDVIYLCSKIERAKELIIQKLNRNPTTYELATYLEMDEEKIIEAIQINKFIKSLDEPINEEGKELTVKDSLYKERYYDDIDLITLRDEFSNLRPNEQNLFYNRYIKDKTQLETALIMGVSQVQVSRDEQKILTKLRSNFHH